MQLYMISLHLAYPFRCLPHIALMPPISGSGAFSYVEGGTGASRSRHQNKLLQTSERIPGDIQ